MKTTNEDHKLLRSITRDTITNDLELIDFELELDLPSSTMKQKLQDYPRSIEMASYMVASEWWDSSDNSRGEKYELLLKTIHSMGKKCTAQRLENVIKENNSGLRNSTRCLDRISVTREGRQHPVTNSASNERDSCNAAGSSGTDIAGLDWNRGNLAICDVGADPSGNCGNLEGNASDFNIISITEEEQGNQEEFRERNSCEIQYSFPPSVQNEAVDIFEGPHTSINCLELEMIGRPIDSSQLDSSFNDQPPIATNLNETQMKVHTSQLNGSFSDKKTNAKSDVKELDRLAPLSKDISSDAAIPKDSEVKKRKIASVRSPKLSRENDVEYCGEEAVGSLCEQLPVNNDFWLDVFEHQNTESEDLMLKNDTLSSKKEKFKKRRFKGTENEDAGMEASPQSSLLRSPSDAINTDDPEVVYHLLPEVHIINASSQDVMSQTIYENLIVHDQASFTQADVVGGQVGVGNSHRDVGKCKTGVTTGVNNGQTGKVNSQTTEVNGQIDEVRAQIGEVNGQICEVNRQTFEVNGQTFEVNGQTGEVSGQKGEVNSQTGEVNGPTGEVNGQTGEVNDESDVQNGQTVVESVPADVMNKENSPTGQTGKPNGQRLAENGNVGVVNGKLIDQNKDVNKIESSGFLHRIIRFFRRKRRVVTENKSDAEFAVSFSAIETTDF